LKSGAVTALAAFTQTLHGAASDAIPVIDAHIHLYDPSRPEGVPWPEKSDSILYKPALPDRYKNVTNGLGICGAIAIECSPWERDNDWLVKTASSDPVIVGVIGDLVPGSPSFRKNLDRLAANSLFRGIRYGNLWSRNLSADMHKPGFIDDLKVLSQAKLVLESANHDGELISALVQIKDKVPDLTVIADHLPNASIAPTAATEKEYTRNLERLHESPRVFIKLSEIPVRVNDEVPLELSFYKDKLNTLWNIFGEDHVLFGSDWPNSDHLASYTATFSLARRFAATKSKAAEENFFWRNSIAAYGWRPRQATQPRG
jgi:predicted TIM-barrel fold metal-dependent hydrolase